MSRSNIANPDLVRSQAVYETVSQRRRHAMA